MLTPSHPRIPGSEPATPLSVSELNSKARRLLEMNFNNVRVEGELSGLARPSSGHWYFTLKDRQAQIRCAMFRNKNQALKFTPSEGMQLLVRGRVSLYEGRGDYQLIVEHMDDAGAGALQKAFEALKLKLANEGLFDATRKKPLPAHPQHIGVVTSPSGAAIRDILAVLKRRFPGIPVTVISSAVQGKEAAPQLVQAIEMAGKANRFDVLIVGRGGGSLEDLWPFNEEIVARAIANCPIPTVSAVGHEIDFTIADFVADYRAPTPSAAAEVLSPDHQAWLDRLQLLQRKLFAMTRHQLQIKQQQLTGISKRLRHPDDRLRENSQRLDDLEIRLKNAMTRKLERTDSLLEQQQQKLLHRSPLLRVGKLRIRQQYLTEQLTNGMAHLLEKQQAQIGSLSAQLHVVSPLATMSRGFSIVEKEGQIIRHASELSKGDTISTRFHEGNAVCEVISVDN